MLNAYITPSPNITEGIVLEVDGVNSFCKARTIKGQILNDVQWLLPVGSGSTRSGSYSTPQMEERVLISYQLGRPIIIGSLPRIEGQLYSPPSITSGTTPPPSGNLTPGRVTVAPTPGRPDGYLAGDHVVASEGGAVLGVLSGGTIVVKAAALSQIIVSKYDDLVRIVARNHEVFTDASTEVSANYRGRKYQFKGYGLSKDTNGADIYAYTEVYGDTALGSELGPDYKGADTTLPEATSTLVRKAISKPQGGGGYQEVMAEEQNADGNLFRRNATPDGDSESNTSQTATEVRMAVEGTVTTSVTIMETAIILISDSTEVLIKPTEVKISVGSRVFLFDDGGLHIT